MNYRMIFNTVGRVLQIEAVLLLLPVLVAVCYLETCAISLAITAVIAGGVGTALNKLVKVKNQLIFAKEGFVTVSLAWISLSLIGALPFIISGEIPNFIDAVFETVSGFTTTGASILNNVESMSHGLLFWRSFTHWIGGMGVLVFVMALSAKLPERSMHILRAEMPGPVVDKLVPRTKDTAKILYIMYVVLTVALTVFLLCGGMPLFDSVVHALGTAGTGGFGIRADSIAGYSPYLQWVITVFMFLFGINFNLYYLILVRKFRSAFSSCELWSYVGTVLISITIISINIYPLYSNFAEVLRISSFQVSSVISTTGYATVDINAMPNLSKTVLFLLMFIGGCAGSTAGGFKVSRIVILFKKIANEMRRALHPRTANVVKMDGKRIEEATISSIGIYLAVYVIVLAIVFLLISMDGAAFDFETNLSAAVSCFNNIGPAFGAAASSYSAYSPFSKIVFTLAMLLGRLEIYPILLALNPVTWLKK